MNEAANAIERACEAAGSQAELARRLAVSPSMVNQWVGGKRPLNETQCAAIERITAGKVPCEELLPGRHWIRIKDKYWPHPQGRPCLDIAAESSPAVPAEATQEGSHA